MTRRGLRAMLRLATHACAAEPVAGACVCCFSVHGCKRLRATTRGLGLTRQGSMVGNLFRHQKRALAFMLHRERPGVGGPAGGILADDQVRQSFCIRSGRLMLVSVSNPRAGLLL